MEQLVKLWESAVLIRFPDCDPFNHLNNSKYIDYFINAREDHLVKYHGFNIYRFAMETGLSWVVSKNQVVYLRPALLMETVVIQTTILKLDLRQIQVEMRMWDEGKNVLKSLMWTSFVHFNLKHQKSESHSKELMDSFSPYVNSLLQNVGFDERVQQVKNKKAAELT